MHRRKTPADYHALAEKRGFRWLGLKVPGVRAKTTWECEDGHQWQASFDSVRRGSGCPVCAGNLPKEPADYHAIAEKRGFRWLGPEVPNTQTRTDWKCAQGHQWQGRYGDIQQGKGCPICGGRLPKEPADYHALADKRGFRWLGPEVSNVRTKTGWACDRGHEWQTTYDSIQGGRDCPICGVAARADKKRTSTVAYHGLARERGFRWIGPEVSSVRDRTGWECEQGHQWQTSFDNIRRGTSCPHCQGRAPLTPADYHALAEERGLRWIGPEVPNNRSKTGWECEQGHQWEAAYSNIQQGSGCPFCWGKINHCHLCRGVCRPSSEAAV